MNGSQQEAHQERAARERTREGRYRQRRRERRQRFKPRLALAQDNSNWVLTVPPGLAPFARFAVPVAVIALIGLPFRKEWIPWACISVFIAVAWAFVLEKWFPQLWTAYLSVAPDGTYSVQRRSGGAVLAHGQAQKAVLRVKHDRETALVSWALETERIGQQFRNFGDADIPTLKTFANTIGAKFEIDGPDEAEGAGFGDVFGLRETLWVIGVGGVIVGGIALALHAAKPSEGISVTNRSLTGTFRSTNKDLGQWTLQPTACLDGHERGFQGIAFQFPTGNPIEEIRVDTAREGDNVVEVRLADRKGTIFRVREQECEKIGGTMESMNLEINGRPQYRLKGNTHFSCSKQGLQGDAEYDGCLPR